MIKIKRYKVLFKLFQGQYKAFDLILLFILSMTDIEGRHLNKYSFLNQTLKIKARLFIHLHLFLFVIKLKLTKLKFFLFSFFIVFLCNPVQPTSTIGSFLIVFKHKIKLIFDYFQAPSSISYFININNLIVYFLN